MNPQSIASGGGLPSTNPQGPFAARSDSLPWVFLQEFGLKSSIDNGPVLSAAIRQIETAYPSGATIIFPKGNFPLSYWDCSLLGYLFNAQFIFQGMGRKSTILTHIGTSGPCIDLSGSNYTAWKDLKVTNQLGDFGGETAFLLSRINHLARGILSDSCNGNSFENLEIDYAFGKAAMILFNAEETNIYNNWIQTYGLSTIHAAGTINHALYLSTKNNIGFTTPLGNQTGVSPSCLANSIHRNRIFSRDTGSDIRCDESIGVSIIDNTLNFAAGPGATDALAGVLLKSPTTHAQLNQIRIIANHVEIGNVTQGAIALDSTGAPNIQALTVIGNEFFQSNKPFTVYGGGAATLFNINYFANRHLVNPSTILLSSGGGSINNSFIETREPFVTVDLGAGGTQNLQTNISALAVANGAIVNMRATAPAATGSAGLAGQHSYAAGFYYVCTATNNWQRVALVNF